jgi:hypothetical protein
MMMPRCGEIVISYDPTATDGFRLGLMTDFGLDVSEAEILYLDDILHIDTDENGGIIAGSNPRSVLLSVYRYLQENGCRWLFPGIDGEFIPMQDIKPTFYHKMADNRFRGQCNEGAEFQQNMMETIDFSPKIGLNVYMLEFDNPACYYDWYYSHECNDVNREPEPVTDEKAEITTAAPVPPEEPEDTTTAPEEPEINVTDVITEETTSEETTSEETTTEETTTEETTTEETTTEETNTTEE